MGCKFLLAESDLQGYDSVITGGQFWVVITRGAVDAEGAVDLAVLHIVQQALPGIRLHLDRHLAAPSDLLHNIQRKADKLPVLFPFARRNIAVSEAHGKGQGGGRQQGAITGQQSDGQYDCCEKIAIHDMGLTPFVYLEGVIARLALLPGKLHRAACCRQGKIITEQDPLDKELDFCRSFTLLVQSTSSTICSTHLRDNRRRLRDGCPDLLLGPVCK